MKNRTTGKSLKSTNLPWLVSLVTLDIFIIMLVSYPGLIQTTSLTDIATARGTVLLVLPVAVLFLSGLLSHDIKAVLVYWKLANVLPAHEAFTRHGPLDARVDMATLKRDVGELPTIPAEQNRLWFKLYKAVENELVVVEAHRMYLLYRDMAAISFLLLIAVLIGFYIEEYRLPVWAAAAVFVAQYVIAALAARHSGVRFVTNVMAIHSAAPGSPQKIVATKKA